MLINNKATKKFAIEIEKSRFPKFPKLARTRVSSEFLNECEATVRNFVCERVKAPQYGKGKKTI